jgi:hypothetical protein
VSVTLPAAGYDYNSDWTLLLAGLSPAGMTASLAARSLRSPGDPSRVFAPLLDPGRTDVPLPWRSHRCCPHFWTVKASDDEHFGAHSRSFGTCSPTLRVSCCHSRARLASGWLAGLYREGVEPSGSLRKVSAHTVILLSCHPDATQIASVPGEWWSRKEWAQAV